MSTQRRGAQWIAQFMKNDRVRGIPKTGPQTVHLFTQCHSSPPCSRAWSALPEGPEWEYELKLDGYRLEAVKDGDKVRLYSRRGNDFTKQVRQDRHRRFQN